MSSFIIPHRSSTPENMRIASRTGVYGIARQNDQILFVKQERGPHSGKFDLPGGGIEAGETIEEALRREFIEEVGMTFDSMLLVDNFTANTDAVDGNGTPYILHQIGLVYSVSGLSPSQNHQAEMEYYWLDAKEIATVDLAPFAKRIR
ncbi:MAG: NUDIX domain-containing protein [Parachlamydiaceae bacterium]